MKHFENRICRVATLHGKEEAIKPHFESILQLKTIGYTIDTDQFGTFSGDVERKASPRVCAKEKCLAAVRNLLIESSKGCLVASEGSFAPHPYFPFAIYNEEILYFLDCDQNFELFISEVFLQTNFSGESFSNIEDFIGKAASWGFPSHTVVVRPNIGEEKSLLFKGIASQEELVNVFEVCQKVSVDSKVWIKTDMRAHKNPTRMKMIGKLAEKLAYRLSTLCPNCETPGWGISRKIPGLPCSYCGFKTHLTECIEFSCCKCEYREKRRKDHNICFANPEFCNLCNP